LIEPRFRAAFKSAPTGIAALEIMSRFAADPRVAGVYLPPTMAPRRRLRSLPTRSNIQSAWDYFRARRENRGCQEKHMGSRAVVVVCRDEATAQRAFASTKCGIVLNTNLTQVFRRFPKSKARFSIVLRGAIGRGELVAKIGIAIGSFSTAN
jgi:hypothetical protein